MNARPAFARSARNNTILLPSTVAGVSVGLAAFANSAFALGLPYGTAALVGAVSAAGAAVPRLVHRLRRR